MVSTNAYIILYCTPMACPDVPSIADQTPYTMRDSFKFCRDLSRLGLGGRRIAANYGNVRVRASASSAQSLRSRPPSRHWTLNVAKKQCHLTKYLSKQCSQRALYSYLNPLVVNWHPLMFTLLPVLPGI